jgi:hypothetical protein
MASIFGKGAIVFWLVAAASIPLGASGCVPADERLGSPADERLGSPADRRFGDSERPALPAPSDSEDAQASLHHALTHALHRAGYVLVVEPSAPHDIAIAVSAQLEHRSHDEVSTTTHVQRSGIDGHTTEDKEQQVERHPYAVARELRLRVLAPDGSAVAAVIVSEIRARDDKEIGRAAGTRLIDAMGLSPDFRAFAAQRQK